MFLLGAIYILLFRIGKFSPNNKLFILQKLLHKFRVWVRSTTQCHLTYWQRTYSYRGIHNESKVHGDKLSMVNSIQDTVHWVKSGSSTLSQFSKEKTDKKNVIHCRYKHLHFCFNLSQNSDLYSKYISACIIVIHPANHKEGLCCCQEFSIRAKLPFS